MITIKADGRLGNRLQYFVLGMYLHEITGMQFIPERLEGFVNTYTTKPGTINLNQIRTSSMYYNINFFDLLKSCNSGLIVDTMILRYELFKSFGDKIRNYLTIDNEDKYEKPNPDDLIMHIRLGDYHYAGGCAVTDKNLYMEAIKRESPSRCIILTDSPNDPYLNDFRNIGCEIRSGSTLGDFVYMKYAKKICVSKSTYSWTAAYISDADRIYLPISDNKWPYYVNPTQDEPDMRPLDKSNWILI